MKKINRKTRIAVIVFAVFLVISAMALFVSHSRNCRDIIGDGYAMGTDPEPVVIGNTCDDNSSPF